MTGLVRAIPLSVILNLFQDLPHNAQSLVFLQANSYDGKDLIIAPVAQLDRVPGFEPGCRGFESLWARKKGFQTINIKEHYENCDIFNCRSSYGFKQIC